MIVVYEPDALEELGAAIGYYAGIFPELAERLLGELDAAVRRTMEFPNSGSPVEASQGCRRCFLTRFPYQIIYRVEGDVIRIYAFAHQKRRPGYWRRRMW